MSLLTSSVGLSKTPSPEPVQGELSCPAIVYKVHVVSVERIVQEKIGSAKPIKNIQLLPSDNAFFKETLGFVKVNGSDSLATLSTEQLLTLALGCCTQLGDIHSLFVPPEDDSVVDYQNDRLNALPELAKILKHLAPKMGNFDEAQSWSFLLAMREAKKALLDLEKEGLIDIDDDFPELKSLLVGQSENCLALSTKWLDGRNALHIERESDSVERKFDSVERESYSVTYTLQELIPAL